MNKILLYIALFFTSASFGQYKHDWKKIKSLKVAYLTEKLELSPTEAQQFWAVYNEFDKKRDTLRKKERSQLHTKMKDLELLCEEDATILLESYFSFEQEKEKLNEAYLQRINKVISAKKTLLLLRSEHDFKRQLIKQYKHNKGGK